MVKKGLADHGSASYLMVPHVAGDGADFARGSAVASLKSLAPAAGLFGPEGGGPTVAGRVDNALDNLCIKAGPQALTSRPLLIYLGAVLSGTTFLDATEVLQAA